MKIENYKLKIAGFTLIELIVCLAIIMVISTVAFWNGRNFNDRLTVQTAAQDVSLAVREAQTYGISVRETGTGTGQFASAYGIDFDTANPTYIIIFADTNGNKVYDSSPDESVEKIYLRNGVRISSICAVNAGGSTVCPGGSWRSIQPTFIRPNPDATITILNPAGNPIGGTWTTAQVTLSSAQGSLKTISVNFTGQISVQ